MERNRFVDVMKGILIIFVLLLHSSLNGAARLTLGFPFWANMAVPAFLLLSGYVCALSFQKKNITTLRAAYAPKGLFRRLIRFLVPFTIAYFLEWIVFRIFKVYLVNIVTYGLRAAFVDYILGGKGQGSYYFPIMVQFVFLFPCLYLAIRKWKMGGLAGAFLVNALYELVKNLTGMSDYSYRFLIFRYLFVIAAGVYVAFFQPKRPGIKFLLAASLAAGLGFIILFSYTSYQPRLVTMWTTTSFPTGLYVFAVFGFLLPRIKGGCKPLEITGKASFNIFLIQMIYYNFADRILPLLGGSDLLFILVSVINCVAVGILFYLGEHKLTETILKFLK